MPNLKKIRRIAKRVVEFNLYKTIYFNVKYVPFSHRFRLPIIVSRHVRIRRAKGRLILPNYKTGSVLLGFDSVGVFDNKRSRSIWEVGDGVIEFRGKANFGNGFKICVHNGGRLVIGKNFVLTAESTIICYKSIEIGDNSLISWDCLFMDTDFHSIYLMDTPHDQINSPECIKIGNNVWIGCRSMILKGSMIPDGSIIAAGSTISKRLSPANTIYASGGKIIKSDIFWRS